MIELRRVLLLCGHEYDSQAPPPCRGFLVLCWQCDAQGGVSQEAVSVDDETLRNPTARDVAMARACGDLEGAAHLKRKVERLAQLGLTVGMRTTWTGRE